MTMATDKIRKKDIRHTEENIIGITAEIKFINT